MEKGAPRAETKTEQSRERELYEWARLLVCPVLAVMLAFTFTVRLIGVEGHSMLPTLQDRDRLLVLTSGLCGGYEPGGRWWTSTFPPGWCSWTGGPSTRTISTS